MANNIYDALPPDFVVRRLSGDHMLAGVRNGMGRLECVVSAGRLFEVDDRGYFDPTSPLPVVNGEIHLRGWEVAFLPDEGELARVGVVT